MSHVENVLCELRSIAPSTVTEEIELGCYVVRGYGEHYIMLIEQADGVMVLERLQCDPPSAFAHTGEWWSASGVACAIAESIAAYAAENT